LLRYAVLAPSSHNTQPWQFRITPEGIEVLPDLSRRLPIADPLDRELWLSVGSTIANLRVAAAHFGFATTILYNAETILVAFRRRARLKNDYASSFRREARGAEAASQRTAARRLLRKVSPPMMATI